MIKSYLYVFKVEEELDQALIEKIGAKLATVFGLQAKYGAVLGKPPHAYSESRRQYRSTRILERMRGRLAADTAKAIALTDLDLYVPQLNFVFGEAEVGGRTAVVSLCRLREEYYGRDPNPKLLFERALKESIHELGHTFGLGHCPNPKCIMRFSNTLVDTDFKSPRFCKDCSLLLV